MNILPLSWHLILQYSNFRELSAALNHALNYLHDTISVVLGWRSAQRLIMNNRLPSPKDAENVARAIIIRQQDAHQQSRFPLSLISNVSNEIMDLFTDPSHEPIFGTRYEADPELEQTTTSNVHDPDHEEPMLLPTPHRVNCAQAAIRLPASYTIASLQASVDLQHRYDRLAAITTQPSHNQMDQFESSTDTDTSDNESTTSTIDYNIPKLYNAPTDHDTVD